MTPLQWKRLFFRVMWWGALILLAFLLATVGAAAWRMYGKAEEARIAHDESKAALESLTERKSAVEKSLSKLSTERGIEEEIRLRYQLAKPGEEQIVLVSKEEEVPTTTPAKKSFWEDVSGWFGQ
jgi:cell division protein FtsB